MEQIVPHMKAMDELTDAEPTDVPHDGFRTLLWAEELVRSKIMGIEVTPTPRIQVVQSLTPTELLVLMYSMVIFQGCYDLQFDEEREDYIDAAGSGFHYLKALRIAFMMGGPQAALDMRNGVRGHWEKFPNLPMKPENVFKYITLPNAARWENPLGDKAPEWCVRRFIEMHVKRWYRDGALQEDLVFEELRID